jgi:hypothetical protein
MRGGETILHSLGRSGKEQDDAGRSRSGVRTRYWSRPEAVLDVGRGSGSQRPAPPPACSTCLSLGVSLDTFRHTFGSMSETLEEVLT